MCLILEETGYVKAKYSTQDIECFKVYVKTADGFYKSPYRRDFMPAFNIIIEEDNFIPTCKDEVYFGYHSFVRLSDAFSLYNMCVQTLWEPIIVKCIIPAYTLYFEGTFSYKKDSYCSKSILLKEIVNLKLKCSCV